MASKEEIINSLESNRELLEKLEKAWKSQSSDEEISRIIAESGANLTLDDVQDILAMRQKESLDDLKKGELDDRQLEAVTGGGDGICDGTANCDSGFIDIPSIPKDQRCKWYWLCDEHHIGDCIKNYIDMSNY